MRHGTIIATLMMRYCKLLFHDHAGPVDALLNCLFRYQVMDGSKFPTVQREQKLCFGHWSWPERESFTKRA